MLPYSPWKFFARSFIERRRRKSMENCRDRIVEGIYIWKKNILQEKIVIAKEWGNEIKNKPTFRWNNQTYYHWCLWLKRSVIDKVTNLSQGKKEFTFIYVIIDCLVGAPWKIYVKFGLISNKPKGINISQQSGFHCK